MIERKIFRIILNVFGENAEVFGTILESASEVDRCMAHPDPKWSMNVKIGRMDVEDKSGFGVGQFVNDSCKPDTDSQMDFADYSEALRKYQVQWGSE